MSLQITRIFVHLTLTKIAVNCGLALCRLVVMTKLFHFNTTTFHFSWIWDQKPTVLGQFWLIEAQYGLYIYLCLDFTTQTIHPKRDVFSQHAWKKNNSDASKNFQLILLVLNLAQNLASIWAGFWSQIQLKWKVEVWKWNDHYHY